MAFESLEQGVAVLREGFFGCIAQTEKSTNTRQRVADSQEGNTSSRGERAPQDRSGRISHVDFNRWLLMTTSFSRTLRIIDRSIAEPSCRNRSEVKEFPKQASDPIVVLMAWIIGLKRDVRAMCVVS